MTQAEIRDGETRLTLDPGECADATLCFIGRIRTPWQRGDCPKNVTRARESGQAASIELDAEFVAGLDGLQVGQGIVLLYWMHGARRDLISQRPRHADSARGTFALRSPNRPNPLAMSAVRITSIEVATGVIGIDALDCFDGTPLVDIKPSAPAVDLPPDLG